MLNKIQLEQREADFLLPYAILSRNSAGREYPESPPEYRTEYQRDRDRVIHSRAFRRLKHKTQVFVATVDGDHYRTRMTHTLEVAQISRDLARALGLNEDVAETIALAHDLGHTPFGHAGEKALDACMQPFGGFEHNQQSKRIVERIEKKYPLFDGLNLTYEVRDGLIKHRTPFDHGETIDTAGPSLEAQCANMGDEVAYNSHDVDDGLASGILTEESFAQVSLWQELTHLHRQQYPALSLKQLYDLNVRQIIHRQISDIFSETTRRIKAFNIATYQDVLHCPEPIICFSAEFEKRIAELRSCLYKNLYSHPTILKRNRDAEQVITGLFAYYRQHPEIVAQASTGVSGATPEQLVCDFIAGMTDQYAIRSYRHVEDGLKPSST
jgi:dGTPase